jgi:hypothetical protein
MGSADPRRNGKVSGAGTVVLDLSHGIITRMSLRSELTLDLTVGGAPKSHRIVNNFSMTSSLESP